MGMLKFKPCPFCGSKKVRLFAYSDGGICVKCLDCDCQTGVYSDYSISNAEKDSAAERVLKAWDQRAPIDGKTLDEECLKHYRQGREDEAALREGRLMQCFNPD
jgi:hypothetical protein